MPAKDTLPETNSSPLQIGRTCPQKGEIHLPAIQDAIPMKATPAAEPMTNKEPPVAAQ